MLPHFEPLGVERVPLRQAAHRFVARPVRARYDLPPFDNSAMDGWAVRSSDLESARADSPVRLAQAGESRAGGEGPLPQLRSGETIRIFTGAVVPPGADTVVMQEYASEEREVVSFGRPIKAGANIRRRGEDLRAESEMLGVGARLAAGEIGLLASQRHAAIDVFRRPVVAVISTGDELRDIGDPAEPHTIVNSNGYALATQIEDAGAVPWVLPVVPDEPRATTEAIREALRADVVLTVGGISVGEHDYVKAAFGEAGVDLDFWKVRMKPGKPLTFGRSGQVPVVGLPGNPVSAVVTFELFVRPGLRRMLGDPRPFRARTRVRLSRDHRHSVGRTELARATLERRPEGDYATPLSLQGSGSLPSMVGVDVLLVLPADVGEFAAESELDALLIHDRLGSPEIPIQD